jgi:tripartite-type tricarboxylate transporter receptor subunit TctC
MKLDGRNMACPQSLSRLACGLALLLGHSWCGAQSIAAADYPSKPIRIIVPFPAGGPTDIAARVVGQAMAESMKTSLVVENKAGGHGFIGVTEAARAPADGYTLMMASIGTMAINPKVLPVQTVPELLSYLKSHPGKVNFASSGLGGSSHLVPEYFKFRTSTFMTHIPYKGSGPAIADVVAGQVEMMFDTLLTSTPFVKSGKLKMLAVTTAKRLPEYPDVPTMGEALGMKDFEASSWYALYAPAGTPPAITRRLASEVDAALKKPAIAKRLTDLGAVPVGSDPQALAAFQRAEQAKWGRVIAAAKIKPE